jgi:endonuclease-3
MQPEALFPEKPIYQPDPRLTELQERLLERYGKPAARVPRDPLSQLIYSLLASRTKTEDANAAMRGLQQQYATWEELRDAPLGEVERAIAGVTFAEVKAPRLKTVLLGITARYGTLTLEFLAKYRTDKIRDWLESCGGVGPPI